MEKIGERELENLCFVLIAGGLGERLGYSGIKISLPVSIIEENYSYMMYYCQYVLACEERAKKLNPNQGPDFYVPLGIMVSSSSILVAAATKCINDTKDQGIGANHTGRII